VASLEREQVEIKDEENDRLRLQLQELHKKLTQQAEDHEVSNHITIYCSLAFNLPAILVKVFTLVSWEPDYCLQFYVVIFLLIMCYILTMKLFTTLVQILK